MGLTTSDFEFPLKCYIPTWKLVKSPSAFNLKFAGVPRFFLKTKSVFHPFSKVLIADDFSTNVINQYQSQNQKGENKRNKESNDKRHLVADKHKT